MKHTYNIGVDVGGSHVSCAYVNKTNGKIVENSFVERKIDSNGTVQEFAESLRLLFGQLFSVTNKYSFGAVGVAMPGPFDYENGISKIQGVQKFDSLYDVNLKKLFKDVLSEYDVPVCFANDATCYALGEYYGGAAQKSKRTIVLTLGTGLGSTFLVNGSQSIEGLDIPPNGYLYNVPFGKSIADNYFSTRWFVNTFKEKFALDISGARETAALAKNDNWQALAIFEEFAENLEEMIFPWITKFQPDTIVIGGNIAKCHPFFLDKLKGKLIRKEVSSVKIKTSELWADAPIVGAAMNIKA